VRDIRYPLLDGDMTSTGGILIAVCELPDLHHGKQVAVEGNIATCPACKDIKVARPVIGRFAKWGVGVIAIAGICIYVGGFVIDIGGRVTTKPVLLYERFEGMLADDQPLHVVAENTRCRAFQIGMKILINFRIWCGGSVVGWTDDTAAFDPPVDMNSIVQ